MMILKAALLYVSNPLAKQMAADGEDVPVCWK